MNTHDFDYRVPESKKHFNACISVVKAFANGGDMGRGDMGRGVALRFGYSHGSDTERCVTLRFIISGSEAAILVKLTFFSQKQQEIFDQ